MGEEYVSRNETLTYSGSNATPVVHNNLPEAYSQCHCCIVEDSNMGMETDLDDLAIAQIRRDPSHLSLVHLSRENFNPMPSAKCPSLSSLPFVPFG
jgi:hypothetical protein